LKSDESRISNPKSRNLKLDWTATVQSSIEKFRDFGFEILDSSDFKMSSEGTFTLALDCTICNSTVMIPFRLTFQPGISIYEQVVYAAKKAVISGQMRPGDPFPSVRALSKALKINPNTAHKVIGQLVGEGLIEVQPGLGTVVAQPPSSTAAERGSLLKKEAEQLVVEAKKLGLDLEEVIGAVNEHWTRLDGTIRTARKKP
jgi:GntR family transcriptional regulator